MVRALPSPDARIPKHGHVLVAGCARAWPGATRDAFSLPVLTGPLIPALSGPWHFLGPFGVGKTEIDGDPIAALGGIRNVSRAKNSKKRMFTSELAEGGLVGWTQLQVPASGAIRLQFPMGDKARVDSGRNVQASLSLSGLALREALNPTS